MIFNSFGVGGLCLRSRLSARLSKHGTDFLNTLVDGHSGKNQIGLLSALFIFEEQISNHFDCNGSDQAALFFWI
jgi:hypothetical protein